MHVVWTGERVRLRPVASAAEYTETDNQLMELPNDYWGPHWRPLDERQQEYEGTGVIDPGWYSIYAIERLDTGELIGLEEHGPIRPGRLRTWLGTHLLGPHQRQGFGIEAKQLMLCALFENYPLELVYAITTSNHRPSRRGLERSGFYLEGRKRGMWIADGLRVDEVFYAITREQWEQLPIRKLVKRGAALSAASTGASDG